MYEYYMGMWKCLQNFSQEIWREVTTLETFLLYVLVLLLVYMGTPCLVESFRCMSMADCLA
jgi:hypothetical protein